MARALKAVKTAEFIDIAAMSAAEQMAYGKFNLTTTQYPDAIAASAISGDDKIVWGRPYKKENGTFDIVLGLKVLKLENSKINDLLISVDFDPEQIKNDFEIEELFVIEMFLTNVEGTGIISIGHSLGNEHMTKKGFSSFNFNKAINIALSEDDEFMEAYEEMFPGSDYVKTYNEYLRLIEDYQPEEDMDLELEA